MAEHRHLTNAPITEAIIELLVKLPSSFQPDNFLSLKDELPERYPTFSTGHQVETRIEIVEGKPTLQEEDLGFQACRLESSDEKTVVQFRTDGFIFSRLKPYTQWEEVFAEAMELWEIYKAITSPEAVTRIAVRYLNDLQIPMPSEFSDYFTAFAELPSDLPQLLAGFLSSMLVHDPETEAFVDITQALEPSARPNRAAIILDIEAFKRVEFEVDSEDITLTLEQLRQLKNRIFFGLITEKTARMYQ